jgi:outer membrane murein-binding lipoprotein Lpp
MRKLLFVLVAVVMLGTILLSGCSQGVSPQDFAAVQSDLAAAKSKLAAVENQIAAVENKVKALSAQSAYVIWWDQYNNIGTVYQAYAFGDAATFHKKLGSLIEGTGDAAVQSAWKDYLNSDSTVNDLIKSWPSDYTKWTVAQTNQWTPVSNARVTALGKVGTALFNTIVK